MNRSDITTGLPLSGNEESRMSRESDKRTREPAAEADPGERDGEPTETRRRRDALTSPLSWLAGRCRESWRGAGRVERGLLVGALSLHLLDVYATVGLVVVGPYYEAAAVASIVLALGDAAGWIGQAVGLLLLKAGVLSVAGVAWALYPSIGGVGPRPFRAALPAVALVRGSWLLAEHAETVGIVTL